MSAEKLDKFMADNAQVRAAAAAQLGQFSQTKYVVLRRDASDTWEYVGMAEGYSYQAAIRQVTDDAGTYVAVPARSWNPTTRSKETTEKDVWT